MVKPEIITEHPLAMYEVLDELEKIQKKENELNFRSQRTHEYLQHFVKLGPKKCKELRDKIEGLNISRLKEPHIIKIVDLMPETVNDLRSILQGYTITIKVDDMKKIIATVNEFAK